MNASITTSVQADKDAALSTLLTVQVARFATSTPVGLSAAGEASAMPAIRASLTKVGNCMTAGDISSGVRREERKGPRVVHTCRFYNTAWSGPSVKRRYCQGLKRSPGWSSDTYLPPEPVPTRPGFGANRRLRGYKKLKPGFPFQNRRPIVIFET